MRVIADGELHRITRKETASTTLDLTGRDSLDIEVTQKVAMTIASIIGDKVIRG